MTAQSPFTVPRDDPCGDGQRRCKGHDMCRGPFELRDDQSVGHLRSRVCDGSLVCARVALSRSSSDT
jgi:hypothetical protein